MIKSTQPSPEAVRATSAGQESEQMFLETVESQNFWKESHPFPIQLQPLFDEKVLEMMGDTVLSLPMFQGLNHEEKKSLTFYLLESDHPKLALELIKRHKVDPNSRDLSGKSLLLAAVGKGYVDLVNYLLEEKADINMQDSEGNSPLREVVGQGNEELAELLINDPNINLDIQNNGGWTPIALAAQVSPSIFNMLKKEGAKVNYITRSGDTPLSAAIIRNKPEAVKRLLEAGADPNLGRPSALTKAIYSHNPQYVKMLIQYGGKPFERDASGRVPVIEAIKRSTPEIIHMLIEETVDAGPLGVNCMDKDGMNPLLAAIFIGNKEVIQFIHNMGGELPEKLKEKAQLILRYYLERTHNFTDYDHLKTLLEWNGSKCVEFDRIVAEYFLYKDPEVLLELIKENYINPNLPMENDDIEALNLLVENPEML